MSKVPKAHEASQVRLVTSAAQVLKVPRVLLATAVSQV